MNYDILLYISILILSYILTKTILRKYQNLPPSPFPTLPIIGHLHLFKNPSHIHRILASLSNKHGPVIHLQFGSRPVLLVSSTSAAIDCLHHNDITFANRPKLTSGKILGYNYTDMIWAPYGPLWRNHRKIASTEILSPHRLHLLSHIRADEMKQCTRHIYDMSAQGKSIEVKEVVFELANNVMMRMIAGKRFYTYNETGAGTGAGTETGRIEGEVFRGLIKEMVDTGPATSAVDFFPVLKYFGKSSREKMYEELSMKLDRFFQGLVDEKKKIQESGSESSSESESESGLKSKSFIEVLLGLHKSDPDYFTDNVIKALVMDLLFGGSETSASTMEWALSLLLNHPEILTRAQNEIHELVGNNRLIEETDINNLPFLRGIINETLRMYPAAALLPPHENSAKCIVGGFQVKEQTMLIVNIWAIQNDPTVWDEPSKFKPERFKTLESDKLDCIFMPFGSGRRACPGQNLATRVVGLALGTLLQCFNWERVGEELVDMEEIVGVTMSKANPLVAKCKPRDDMIRLISSI